MPDSVTAASPRATVLGDLRIDGEPISSGRVRTLFARLAVAPGEIVSEDALLDALWPAGPPKSGRTALHTYIGALRDLLEPERSRRSDGSYLFRRHGGYLLDLAEQLDATILRHGVDEAETLRHTNPGAAASTLDTALDLWQQPAFAECASDEWALGPVGTLEEYATRALIVRSELALDAGDHEAAILRLEEGHGAHPYNERITALLMRALGRAGRQTDALELYQQARRTLVDELGVEPGPELRAAEHDILMAEPEPIHAPAPPTFEDDSSHFVGRIGLQAEIREQLGDRRLVTLVGPGGVGKTRLARRMAATLSREWQVPVAFVDLAETEPEDAVVTVAAALGVREHDGFDLLDATDAALERRDLLIVLDTCEHIAPAIGSLLDHLLQHPSVRVMATSRSPLGHRHELALPVEPLATDEAITLLLHRAGFDGAGDDEKQALGEISRRLDGLPLAIELAAGRLRSLSADQLAELLRRSRASLRGGDDRPLRHRSLDETIAWSYDLISPEQQRLLRSAALFRGPFSHAVAARFWGVDEGQAADALLELVDRSLVSRSGDGALRFRLLDTVRDFALARSDDLEESPALDARHASLLVELSTDERRGDIDGATDTLLTDSGPALDALSITGDDRTLDMIVGLGAWWIDVGRNTEARHRIHTHLRMHPTAGESAVRALLLSATLAWLHGDIAEARADIARAQSLTDDDTSASVNARVACANPLFHGDADTAATKTPSMLDTRDGEHELALLIGARVHEFAGTDEVDRWVIDLRDHAQAADHPSIVALAQTLQALAWCGDGRPERGRALLEKWLADPTTTDRAYPTAALALATLQTREPDLAAERADDALRLVRTELDPYAIQLAVLVAARTLFDAGDAPTAAVAWGWLEAMIEERDLPVPAIAAPLRLALRDDLRGALDPPTFRTATANGSVMDRRELLDALIGDPKPSAPPVGATLADDMDGGR